VVLNPPPGFPILWTVNRLKIACLLRVADAAHLDDRRAPRILRAARELSGLSREHWEFQGHLAQPRADADRLVFTAGRPFGSDEAPAWWLAFETIGMVDTELRQSDALLADSGLARMRCRSVAGADSPERFRRYLPTLGWEPIETRVRIGDISSLIARLGGAGLYGDEPSVPLRELIQNACDAVRARIALAASAGGRVTVRTGVESGTHWVEVEDDGLGMSQKVVTGPLLDFGQSYWKSPLSRTENPGLAASGFEPVGRYGIGFFSVFMWGDRVRVTTRRDEDRGSETRILEFNTGVRSRPVLRTAASQSEQLRGPGTKVRVWLSKDPLGEGGLLKRGAVGKWSLAGLVAWLAPAVDVDIAVEVDGKPSLVVGAGDWKTLPSEEFFGRIWAYSLPQGVESPRTWLGNTGARLTLLEESGRVVGRAAVLARIRSDMPGWYASFPCGVVCVGGLRAGASQHFAGILVGSPVGPSRMTARPVANWGALQTWAKAQVELLLGDTRSPSDLSEEAAVLLACGADIRQLPVARCSSGWLTLDQVVAWAESRATVIVLQDAAYSSLMRHHPELQLVDEVLVLDVTGAFQLLDSHMSNRWTHADESWPTRPEVPRYDRFYDCYAIGGAVGAAVAHAWHVTEGDLWASSLRSTDKAPVERVIGRAGDCPLGKGLLTRPRAGPSTRP
jgi:hypothetical protein